MYTSRHSPKPLPHTLLFEKQPTNPFLSTNTSTDRQTSLVRDMEAKDQAFGSEKVQHDEALQTETAALEALRTRLGKERRSKEE